MKIYYCSVDYEGHGGLLHKLRSVWFMNKTMRIDYWRKRHRFTYHYVRNDKSWYLYIRFLWILNFKIEHCWESPRFWLIDNWIRI